MIMDNEQHDAAGMVAVTFFLQLLETKLTGMQLRLVAIMQRTATFYSLAFILGPQFPEHHEHINETLAYHPMTIIVAASLGDVVLDVILITHSTSSLRERLSNLVLVFTVVPGPVRPHKRSKNQERAPTSEIPGDKPTYPQHNVDSPQWLAEI